MALRYPAMSMTRGQDPLLTRLQMMASEDILADGKWVGLTDKQSLNKKGINLGPTGNYLIQRGVFSNLAELNSILITRSGTLSERLEHQVYLSECMKMIRNGGASIKDIRNKMIADGMLTPLAATDTYAALEAAAEFGGGEAGAYGSM